MAWLLCASYVPDMLSLLFVAMGLERGDLWRGLHAVGSPEPYRADFSHALFSVIALTILAALLGSHQWGRRQGAVLGYVVASHWIVDVVSAYTALPLLPGNLLDLPRFGLGLSQWPIAAHALDLTIGLAGVFWLVRHHAPPSTDAGAGRTIQPLIGVVVIGCVAAVVAQLLG